MIKIIDYSNKYDEDIKNLLVELQEYISKLDREKYNVISSSFREEYFKEAISTIKKYEGKIFLAMDNEMIVGAIFGVINNDNIDSYSFKAPKRGRVTELIVANDFQKNGIGKLLLDKMEAYFKSVGCSGVLLDVFAYNEVARDFYLKNGYFDRTMEMMKNI